MILLECPHCHRDSPVESPWDAVDSLVVCPECDRVSLLVFGPDASGKEFWLDPAL